jgi:hypothetical protein
MIFILQSSNTLVEKGARRLMEQVSSRSKAVATGFQAAG